MTMAVRSPRTYSKTTYMALCGLFAALMAVCSFICIPLGFTPVPVNLATLGVFLTGGLLGRKYGTISMTVYVLLGAVGLPIFSEFRGGLSVLVGPTGGYIIGYIAGAFLVGLLTDMMLGSRCLTVPAKKRSGEVGADTAAKAGALPSGGTVREIRSRGKELACCVIAMTVGLLACYLLGTAWFMFTTHTGIWAALVACVFPFLPGDVLKIAAGALLVQKLRRLL